MGKPVGSTDQPSQQSAAVPARPRNRVDCASIRGRAALLPSGAAAANRRLTCNRRLRVVAVFLVRDMANFSPRQIAGAVFCKGGSITAGGPLPARASIDYARPHPKAK